MVGKAEPAIGSYASLSRLGGGGAGGVGPVLQLGETAALDGILAEDRGVAPSRGYWIKSSNHRFDDEGVVLSRVIVAWAGVDVGAK